MTFFYAAIAMIGVIYAAMVQSSRGLISVVMGIIVAHYLHMPHLETKHGRGVVVRRAMAAVLMAMAICLYAYSQL